MSGRDNISRRAALTLSAAGVVGTLMPRDAIERAARAEWGSTEVAARVRAAIVALGDLAGVRRAMAACQRSMMLHHPLSPESVELRDRQFEFMQAQFHAEKEAFEAIGRIMTDGPHDPAVVELATSLFPHLNAGHLRTLKPDGDKWVEREGSGLARMHERPRRVPRDFVAQGMRDAWVRTHS